MATGLPFGLRTSDASPDVDMAPVPHVRSPTELRYLHGKDAVFPSHSGVAQGDPKLVTSLGLTW